jgi:Ser/Thr protein kinase RdoA (MazF antagonist)
MEKEIVSLLREELVAEAASQWAVTGETKLLDDVSNFVYEFRSEKTPRILRFTHSSHRTEEEIIAELDWLDFLIQNGIPASRPLPSRNGRLTELHPAPGSYFTAVAFEFAPGRFIKEGDPMEWNPPFFRKFGRIMGKMHRVTKGYSSAHLRRKRFHWTDDETLQNAAAYLPADQQQAAGDLEQLLALFNHHEPRRDDFGLVHNDLNPTNFHVHDGLITLFDFDDCCYNWFINDIAVVMPLYSPMFAKEGWESGLLEFLRCFMQGYSEENSLDESWLDLIPASLRMQNLISLVACHQSDVPNSRYRSFYELVLRYYRQGHPLFSYDFRKALRSG